MRRFHASIHARPPAVRDGACLVLEDGSLQTLAVRSEHQATLLDVRFEQAFETLAALPRLFIELDGSFVWVSEPASELAWQIDGVLWDRGNRLFSAELKGRCPEAELDCLLGSFGWPQTPLMFQLVQQAAFVEERTFRRYLYDGRQL